MLHFQRNFGFFIDYGIYAHSNVSSGVSRNDKFSAKLNNCFGADCCRKAILVQVFHPWVIACKNWNMKMLANLQDGKQWEYNMTGLKSQNGIFLNELQEIRVYKECVI